VTPALSRTRLGRRVARFALDPLVRTSWPLILNTGLNGLLGVMYWVVAARVYDQDTVGTNMAVIAAMATLSGITQLNLGTSLAVLVPRAGPRGRRVVWRVYIAVTSFALLILGAFLALVLPHLSKLAAVLDDGERMLTFAVAVLAFNIFALQDAALVALRKGKLVPLENTTFGILKVALLAPLFVLLPGFGIFVSWMLPILLIIPVMSWFVFVDRRGSEVAPPRDVNARREPLSKLALDYLGYLFQVSATFFLPVVALELVNPGAAAVFAVAWQTSSTLDLLATNVGTALTVETSYGHDPAALRRTVFRQAMPLVALATFILLLAAPLVLHLYGARYSHEGANTLRLLLLASVPRSLVTFAVAEARAHRNITFILALRIQNAVLVLGLAAVLAPRFGVQGIAAAWLTAQLAGGLVALRHMLRKFPQASPAGPPSSSDIEHSTERIPPP